MAALVTGPGTEGRKVDDPNVGVSLAVYLATRRDVEDGTWYVRDSDDVVAFRVERHMGGVVTVEAAA